jgi:hypothetical protein
MQVDPSGRDAFLCGLVIAGLIVAGAITIWLIASAIAAAGGGAATTVAAGLLLNGTEQAIASAFAIYIFAILGAITAVYQGACDQ